jgi:hypothetical protein
MICVVMLTIDSQCDTQTSWLASALSQRSYTDYDEHYKDGDDNDDESFELSARGMERTIDRLMKRLIPDKPTSTLLRVNDDYAAVRYTLYRDSCFRPFVNKI